VNEKKKKMRRVCLTRKEAGVGWGTKKKKEKKKNEHKHKHRQSKRQDRTDTDRQSTCTQKTPHKTTVENANSL
jgi:hypothetical protein